MVTLSGANTYTGDTTISGGTLKITGDTVALGSGDIVLGAGGTFAVTNNAALSLANDVVVNGDATITSDTAGAVAGVTHTLGDLSLGAHTLTVNLGMGTPSATSTQGLAFGAVTLTGNANIVVKDDATGGLLTLASVTGAGHGFIVDGTSTADVTITGTVNTGGGAGQQGGDVSLSTSKAISTGAITTSGGSYGDGVQDGGAIVINAGTTASLASLAASGGASTGDFVGSGGAINILAETLTVSGAIRSLGGLSEGAGVAGGQGGTITIDVEDTATLAFLIVSGGESFAGAGGSGGDVTFNGGIVGVTGISTQGGVAVSGGDGGSVTINAGTVTVSGTIDTSGGASGSGADGTAGKLILNEGTLNFASLTGGGDVNFRGGTLQYGTGNTRDLSSQIKDSTNAIKIDTNGNDLTYASAIVSSNTGGLTKSGAGTLTLSGVNAYTGATTIREGTVNFNQSLTASALNFSGDGTAVFASGTNVTNAITNDFQNQGTVQFSDGAHTVSGDIGSTGTGVKLVQVGTFDTHFNGDVKATSFAFTGNGGYVDVAAGKSITLQDAALTVNTNGASTINYLGSTTIANDLGTSAMRLAYINFNGGTAILGANIYTDPTSQGGDGKTTVDNATLNLTGDRTVGGMLKLQNGAAVDIGLNTLTTDSYTQSSGTTLKLTVNSASDYGSIASAGTGNVAGTISALMNGYVANGATLDIGNFSGGLSSLTASVMLDPLGDQHGTLTGTIFGTDILRLTMDRSTDGFASDAAGDPNAAAVGSVLDNISGASGDMLDVLNTLDGMSAGAVGTSLGTMTPDVSSGAVEGSRSLTGNLFTMMSNRLGGARGGGMSGSGVSSGETSGGVGVWGQALGSNMKQNARKGIQGFSANTWGTTVGADQIFDRHIRLGLAGSYGWAGVKAKTPGSPSDNINSFQGALYGSYDSLDLCEARQGGKKSPEAVRTQVEDSWYVDGMLAFTQNNYDSRREIWVGSSKRVAKADHYGQQYSTNFETGYKFVFEETKDLEVTPFAGLGYNYLYMNKYKEKGADALNLHVEGEGFHQLEQSLGMKLAYPIVNKKLGTFIPSGKAAWLYDYIGDRFETTANFAGGGASFDTVGAKPAKSGMLFGAELAFLNKGNMTVTGNWDIEIKDEFLSNTYYGTVRYDF